MQVADATRGEIEYRLEKRGSKVALILHGGHMNASVHIGEDYFLEHNYTTLVVSRPGYGKTPLSAGDTPTEFAETLHEFLQLLAIDPVVLVGISAGGRTAMKLAAIHPENVEKLILQSSLSFAPWPDMKTRVAAYIAFNPFAEKCSWSLLRRFLNRNPRAAVKMMLANMTTLEPKAVVNIYSEQQLQALIEVFGAMSSGNGFMADMKVREDNATDVKVPTLIVHSNYDKTVPLSHPHLLAQEIQQARLYLTEAESHLIWFSSHYLETKKVMDDFLGV
jgi:pimeloyl-ACP methyl ester carboxylesterase